MTLVAQPKKDEPYYTLEQMISWGIEEPNRSVCQKILADNRKLFQTVQGSTHNHQNWPGGYFDHVQEVMNWVFVFYETIHSRRPLLFSLSSALLIMFLHDIEKPWKYELGPDNHLQIIPALKEKSAQHEFRKQKLQEYGIVLTPEEENALKYVEGELNDYTSHHRVMNELAGFCHLCDITSARICHSYPLEKNDPWFGARRIRD